eukprot:GEMP01000863.1.p1 GENE.GEMP01000863.1~~GEMP01000863.1.p1  ORF type:complete len:1521 (+),score=296.99 GEMP01000863.1:78-4640(+)
MSRPMDAMRTTWMVKLLDMGFPLAQCEYAISKHGTFDAALMDIIENPNMHIPASFFGVIDLDDDDDDDDAPLYPLAPPRDKPVEQPAQQPPHLARSIASPLRPPSVAEPRPPPSVDAPQPPQDMSRTRCAAIDALFSFNEQPFAAPHSSEAHPVIAQPAASQSSHSAAAPQSPPPPSPRAQIAPGQIASVALFLSFHGQPVATPPPSEEQPVHAQPPAPQSAGSLSFEARPAAASPTGEAPTLVDVKRVRQSDIDVAQKNLRTPCAYEDMEPAPKKSRTSHAADVRSKERDANEEILNLLIQRLQDFGESTDGPGVNMKSPSFSFAGSSADVRPENLHRERCADPMGVDLMAGSSTDMRPESRRREHIVHPLGVDLSWPENLPSIRPPGVDSNAGSSTDLRPETRRRGHGRSADARPELRHKRRKHQAYDLNAGSSTDAGTHNRHRKQSGVRWRNVGPQDFDVHGTSSPNALRGSEIHYCDIIGVRDFVSKPNTWNALANAVDVLDLGRLSSLEELKKPQSWMGFSTSDEMIKHFSEARNTNRMACYSNWYYSRQLPNAHEGTDMHIAHEGEGMDQYRWLLNNGSMAINMKSAVNCIVKDFRFVPRSVNCFYRSRHLQDKVPVDPATRKPPSFCPPNNNKDAESEQPPDFRRFPLRPEQLRSLAWMRSREANTASFKVSYIKMFHGWPGKSRIMNRGVLFSDQKTIAVNNDYLGTREVSPWSLKSAGRWNYKKFLTVEDFQRSPSKGARWTNQVGVDVKIEVEYDSRGGILADQLGYGKTATALGLIAFDTPGVAKLGLEGHMTDAEKETFFAAESTLVLVPPNLMGQWVEQIAKFYLPPGTSASNENLWRTHARNRVSRGYFGCPKSVICFDSVAKLKMLTPEDIAQYDIIICTMRIFFSSIYERRREALASFSPEKDRHSMYDGFDSEVRWPNHETPDERSKRNFELHGNLKDATKKHFNKLKKTPFPVLEQFFWRRVIYDESHEIERLNWKVQMAITEMRTQFCWGLTGSPVLDTLRGIDTISMILRIDLVGWDHKHLGWTTNSKYRERANAFVQEFVRKNTETSYAPIPMEEQVIRVMLQPEERALYLAQFNISSEQAQLVQLCSHFSGGESENLDATTEVDRVLEKKRSNVSDRTDALQGLFAFCAWLHNAVRAGLLTLPNSWYSIATAAVEKKIQTPDAKAKINAFLEDAKRGFHLDKARFLNPPEEQVFHFLKRSDVGGRFDWDQCRFLKDKDKALLLPHFNKRITRAVEGYRDALSALTFFEVTVSVLRNNLSERTCPVCLDEDLELQKIAVSACGHVYCIDCMKTLLTEKMCAVCRHSPLTMKDFSILKPQESYGVVEREKSKFEEFGSKMYVVYKKLQEIRREDPTAKVIMFTQFSWLRKKYENVLEKFGIPFITLHGTTAQRSATIDSFQNCMDSKAWVLLMDLSNSASGTHITSANHVIFIHPMVCDSSETAAAYEKQAIGRCRRYGQTKTVKVWRFVASNTIEEEITALHQLTIVQQPAPNPFAEDE